MQAELIDTARQRVAELDRKHGEMCDLREFMRVVRAAVNAGLRDNDWNPVADAFVMLDNFITEFESDGHDL